MKQNGGLYFYRTWINKCKNTYIHFSTYCIIQCWKTNAINIIYKTFQTDCDAVFPLTFSMCNSILHISIFIALKKGNSILNGLDSFL